MALCHATACLHLLLPSFHREAVDVFRGGIHMPKGQPLNSLCGKKQVLL